jgi:hypothetical protein
MDFGMGKARAKLPYKGGCQHDVAHGAEPYDEYFLRGNFGHSFLKTGDSFKRIENYGKLWFGALAFSSDICRSYF